MDNVEIDPRQVVAPSDIGASGPMGKQDILTALDFLIEATANTPRHFVMSTATRIKAGLDESVYAGIPIVIDLTMPPDMVYLLPDVPNGSPFDGAIFTGKEE